MSDNFNLMRETKEGEPWSDVAKRAWDTRGRKDDDKSSDSKKDEKGSKAREAAAKRPKPIRVKSVQEAVDLILEGKVVEVEDTRTVHTVLTKLASIADEAAKLGKDAPNYDLCQVSVANTNLFCTSKLRTEEYPEGVPRIQMPQMSGNPVPGSKADQLTKNKKGEVDGAAEFVRHLTERGIKSESTEVQAYKLKASQAELVGPKVAGMMVSQTYDPGKEPIFISRDDYVVDGHHRWAAVVGRDSQDNRLGDLNMRVVRIDAPISEILHIANDWASEFGIAAKAAGKGAKVLHVTSPEAFQLADPFDAQGRPARVVWANRGVDVSDVRSSAAHRMYDLAVTKHQGLLVSLWLDTYVAEQLAVRGGEDPDDMHVTLCYCGHVDDIGPRGIYEAIEIVRSIASQVIDPLIGRVGGVGKFLPSETSDGAVPIYATADVPGLSELRASLATALAAAGISPRSEHGWVPHITLKYAKADDERPLPKVEDIALIFRGITVSAGETRIFVPFSPMGALLSERIDLPTTADVAGPMAIIGGFKQVPPKPKKRRRKPVYWSGMKLSRFPTAFEASTLSLSEIPVRLSAEMAETVTSMTNSRVRMLDDEPEDSNISRNDLAREDLGNLQLKLAQFGAREVDREIARQRGEGEQDCADSKRDARVAVAVAANERLKGSRDTAADALNGAWRSQTRRLSARVTRAKRRGQREASTLWLSMAAERASDGLPSAVSEVGLEAFAFGRSFRMGEHVASKKGYRARMKQLAESDVLDDDLVDYVVQSAILDNNTCEECEAVHGEVFEFGTEEQEDHEPPFFKCLGGNRCRCLQILVVGDWRDKATVRDAVGSDRLAVATEKQAEKLIKDRQRYQAEEEDDE